MYVYIKTYIVKGITNNSRAPQGLTRNSFSEHQYYETLFTNIIIITL